MNKLTFQALPIQSQIDYLNTQLLEGKSISGTCREIGISKSVCAKYKSHNYIIVDNQYTLTPPNTSTQTQEVAVDTITLPKVKSVKKPQETKKIGRPCKLVATTKLTLEVDKSLHKKLKVYCAINELKMNEYITKLLLDNLK